MAFDSSRGVDGHAKYSLSRELICNVFNKLYKKLRESYVKLLQSGSCTNLTLPVYSVLFLLPTTQTDLFLAKLKRICL